VRTVRRPSPAEELRTAWLLRGELVGHTHRDVLEYADAMSELNDLEEAGRGVDGVPSNVVSPDVEPTGWRSWLRRRR
jgi:hypothetical protein